MTKSEVSKIVAIIATTYRPGAFPQDRAEIYERLLVELDREKLEAAVLRLMRTHKWPPEVAEIFEAYGVVETGRMLEPGEAYELVNNAVRKFGRYQPEPAMQSLPERVRRAVAALGGFLMVCDDTYESALRARFFEVYGSLSKIDGDDRSARSVALPEGSNVVPLLRDG